MKISLITINRNNAPGLKRTLASVAAAKMALGNDHSLEHVIIDGYSDDGSLDLIIPEREAKIIRLTPKGVYHAINEGLRNSTGHIIGFLHAGDVFSSPDILSRIAERFNSPEPPDYIRGDLRIGKRLYSGEDFSVKTLQKGIAPPHPTLYVSRQAFKTIGFYDESYRIAADFDYFVRLKLTSSLRGDYIPAEMVVMERGGISQSLRSRLLTNNREKLKALKTNGLKSSRLRLLSHYSDILKGYICSSKKK